VCFVVQEILRTRIALELGTMERVLSSWRGVARCAAVRGQVDEGWRFRRQLDAFRSWAWCAERHAWCGRVVTASSRLRRQQTMLSVVIEWRYAAARERRLERLASKHELRQQR
jgi:hypothetical protein